MTELFEIKERLITETLKQVPFAGWNHYTIRKAAVNIGLEEGWAEILFPQGIGELIELFTKNALNEMLIEFNKLPLDTMKIRDKIKVAIKILLEQNIEHRQAIKQMLVYYSFPFNLKRSLQQLWSVADETWHACGDNATDFNYYSKRTLLGGVYLTTLSYWVNDFSDQREETWRFLDRRIDQVMKIPNVKKKVKTLVNKLPLIRMLMR